MRQCPTCLKRQPESTTQCPECCVALMNNEVSSEDGDDGVFHCDICGTELLPCDTSPLYGKSWLHPENSCVKAGLWWGCEKAQEEK